MSGVEDASSDSRSVARMVGLKNGRVVVHHPSKSKSLTPSDDDSDGSLGSRTSEDDCSPDFCSKAKCRACGWHFDLVQKGSGRSWQPDDDSGPANEDTDVPGTAHSSLRHMA